MKISVDVDGVLLEFVEKFCEIFNERYSTSYRKSDITRWEFFSDWNVSEEQCYEIFYEIYGDSMTIPLIDDKIPEYLEELNAMNKVDIVSARSSQYKSQLEKKLTFHGIKQGLHYRNLILVNSKPYDLKLTHDYDIYVDDNPNLVEPLKKKMRKYLLLFDQPWNQECKCEKNVIRVNNWKEVVEKIMNLERKFIHIHH